MLRPDQPPVQLTTGGKAITLTAGAAPFYRRDDRMFRVTTGFGESLPFSIFSTRETLEAEAEPRLYARLAPHQFLRLRATLNGPESPPGTPFPPVPAVAPPAAGTPIRKAIPLGPEEQDFPDKIPEKGTL